MLIFPHIHTLAALVRMDGCFIRLNRHILNFKKWPKHQNASECWSQTHIPPGKDNLIGPGGYLFTQASRQPWDCLLPLSDLNFPFYELPINLSSQDNLGTLPRSLSHLLLIPLWFCAPWTWENKNWPIGAGWGFLPPSRRICHTILKAPCTETQHNRTSFFFLKSESPDSQVAIFVPDIFRSILKLYMYHRAPWLP